MTAKKDDRLISAIHAAAAEFINRESNRRSLVTVTSADLPDEKHARVFISVFPQKDAHAAMDFLARRHGEFMAFLKKSVKLHTVPIVSFLPDPAMGSVADESEA